MNLERCYQYVVFLNAECDRYLADGQINEDEMLQLKIEFDRFMEEVRTSNLPSEVLRKIANLKLDYIHRTRWEYADLLGSLSFGKQKRRRVLTEMVEEFKFQIQGVPMWMQMKYSQT